MPDHIANRPDRRGVLLLLVLSCLTLFMMLGAIMLVLATRARTSARAFAAASSTVSREDIRGRQALDDALMALLRGTLGAGPISESILADRYGSVTQQGRITALSQVNTGTLQASLTGFTAATPLQLNGCVLTIKPAVSDPAPVQSYRIVNFANGTATLANLRGAQPFVLRPATFPCDAFVNGRDFGDSAGNEPWDKPDPTTNPFLTDARLQGVEMSVSRPAFGTSGTTCTVDNDADGKADGIWLTGVLPAQVTASGSVSYRVSYLVLDLDGRFNVNAHGVASGTATGVGPASVDGNAAFCGGVWNKFTTGTGVQFSGSSSQQRRPAPVLGYAGEGRLGRLSGTTSPYALRLDLNGPRPGCPTLDGERVAAGTIASLFTPGEMERVLRAFDPDAAALAPRLAGILGDDAQKARMLVTTDSWDTTGLAGDAAKNVVAVTSTTGLPPDVIEGRRFNINGGSMASPATKQAFFEQLLAVVLVAGAPSGTSTAQWVANVVEFRDSETPVTTGTFTTGTSYAGKSMVTGTVIGHEDPQYGAFGGNLPSQTFTSIGQLLCVPRGSKEELEKSDCPPELKRSLAADSPAILDTVTVPSLFTGALAANPWREPGRVNVNTAHGDVWQAVLADSTSNPFNPARSAGSMLTDASFMFTNAERPYTAVRTDRANRIANIATTRSNMFAVWTTVEISGPGPDDPPKYRRLFAIVDRSIPVGFSPGVNLNVRDTLRLVRYLD